MSIQLYRSSAGSGKTFTLARTYLGLVLPDPQQYRRVLAITFTNAAAAEMKERIVEYLVRLREGNFPELEEALRKDGLTDDELGNAGQVLENILFDYSHFSVSTIDSFFNRIVTSFGKELDLPHNVRIELDEKAVYQQVVDRLLEHSRQEADYRELLQRFIEVRIQEGKSLQLERDFLKMLEEARKEQAIDYDPLELEALKELMTNLYQHKGRFESRVKPLAEQAVSAWEQAGYNEADWLHGPSGVAGFILKVSKSDFSKSFSESKRSVEALEDVEKWVKKGVPQREEKIQLAEQRLQPLLQQIESCYTSDYPHYTSCLELLKNVWSYGVLRKLSDLLEEVRMEQGLILISDLPRILNERVREEAMPFIYSRVGVKYNNYLIDEFQDTSSLQWQNLFPLLENAVAEGHTQLVVGDPKQAIYRWRGGDVRLIEEQLTEQDFPGLVSILQLQHNYRSCREIIDFNNNLFPKLVKKLHWAQEDLLTKIYTDVVQQEPVNCKTGGHVQVSIFPGKAKECTDRIHENVLKLIGQVCNKGYQPKDLCLLVRTRAEGSQIAQLLFQHGHHVVSQESLLLQNNPRVQFFLSLLRHLEFPDSALYRTEAVYFYKRFVLQEEVDQNSLFPKATDPGFMAATFPDAFTEAREWLPRLSLYEMMEELVRIFGLNEHHDAFMQRLLDAALEFATDQSNNVVEFLEWIEKQKINVELPKGLDAIRVMTIHNAKGLQFPVVILPYANWEAGAKGNQDEMMWVQNEQEPFHQAGLFPVKYTQRLKDTLFAGEYEREQELKTMDMLNMLYVALTRPVEQLHLFTNYEKGTKPHIGSYLKEALTEEPIPEEGWQYSQEEPPGPQRKREEPDQGNLWTLTRFPSYRWNKRLKIAAPAVEAEGTTPFSMPEDVLFS